jgi:hypothetical protein
MGVRIVMAWIVGSLIARGSFNHAIVGRLELVYRMRHGLHVPVGHCLANLGLAIAGDVGGGLGLVTFARFAQAAVGTSGSR